MKFQNQKKQQDNVAKKMEDSKKVKHDDLVGENKVKEPLSKGSSYNLVE